MRGTTQHRMTTRRFLIAALILGLWNRGLRVRLLARSERGPPSASLHGPRLSVAAPRVPPAGTSTSSESATTTTPPPPPPVPLPPRRPATTRTDGADHGRVRRESGRRSRGHTAGASELITVQASTYDTTYATLTAWQREGPAGSTCTGPGRARIGAAGSQITTMKGTTRRRPARTVSARSCTATPRTLACTTRTISWSAGTGGTRTRRRLTTTRSSTCLAARPRPSAGGSEPLWQETNAYPSFAFIEYNTDPVVSGAGSAIFLHADVGSGTAGCVTLPLAELDEVLRWLNPAAGPLVVMGPDSEIDDF